MTALAEPMKRRRRRRAKRRGTVAAQIGVSQATVSAKIRKVANESPELSQRQVKGKAIGILKHRKKKGKPPLD